MTTVPSEVFANDGGTRRSHGAISVQLEAERLTVKPSACGTVAGSLGSRNPRSIGPCREMILVGAALVLRRAGRAPRQRFVIRLRAPIVRLVVDRRGRAARLEARKRVRIEVERSDRPGKVVQRSGQADRASASFVEQTLTLVGHARLRDPETGIELDGREITLHLASGRVEARAVRVHLVPASGARP